MRITIFLFGLYLVLKFTIYLFNMFGVDIEDIVRGYIKAKKDKYSNKDKKE